jgi:hypothetical protein
MIHESGTAQLRDSSFWPTVSAFYARSTLRSTLGLGGITLPWATLPSVPMVDPNGAICSRLWHSVLQPPGDSYGSCLMKSAVLERGRWWGSPPLQSGWCTSQHVAGSDWSVKASPAV